MYLVGTSARAALEDHYRRVMKSKSPGGRLNLKPFHVLSVRCASFELCVRAVLIEVNC